MDLHPHEPAAPFTRFLGWDSEKGRADELG